MKFNKTQIFFLLLVLQIIVNLLFLFNINYFLIRTILSFLFIISVPGLFILLSLKINKINFYEYLSYMVSLSISFLIFVGLFINYIFPLIGFSKPLSDLPLAIGFNTVILVSGFIAYIRSGQINYEIKSPRISLLNWILLLIPLVILALGVFGAIILNNGGSNFFARLMIVGVATYIFLLTLLRNKIQEKIYPLVIVIIGLALLLSYSLRSWHILGWDINLEYQMFQLTRIKSLWAVSNSASNFNSCLSITILPTIFSSFLHINNEYIFKLISQLLFAIVPLNIYLITRRYAEPLLAFFCSFFFVAQEVFYMEQTAIVRQEIAFIFFTSMVLVLFNRGIKSLVKNILFLTFGVSMVVSHYSTTYVALALFFLTYLVLFVIRHFKKSPNVNNSLIKNITLKNYHIRLTSISILLFVTIFWNIQVTKSFDYLKYTVDAVIRNIDKTFTLKDKNATIFSFLFNSKNIYSDLRLDKFIQDYTSHLKVNKSDLIMKGETRNINKLHLINDVSISSKKVLLNEVSVYPYVIVKYIILLSLAIGTLKLLMTKLKSKSKHDLEYLLLSLTSISLIILMIILPHISVAYNVNRFFLQGLTFLSFCIVMGIMVIFRRLGSFKFYMIAIIFIIYYLYQSGITASITGNVLRINTFNKGAEYDAHYIHEEDVSAIKWMAVKYKNYEYVYMDAMAVPKFKSVAVKNINKIPYVIPNIIDKSNYVYASYGNTHENVAFIEDVFYSSGSLLTINYPFNFLDDNKNLIYNNGGAKIYK